MELPRHWLTPRRKSASPLGAAAPQSSSRALKGAAGFRTARQPLRMRKLAPRTRLSVPTPRAVGAGAGEPGAEDAAAGPRSGAVQAAAAPHPPRAPQAMHTRGTCWKWRRRGLKSTRLMRSRGALQGGRRGAPRRRRRPLGPPSTW